MFQSTRSFLRRHRTNIAVGFGLAGAGYLAAQYVSNKLSEARTRMMSDRVARENIHRRFQQNQEDCSFTVLALLPTATENIAKELPVEQLTQELQKKKAARIAKSTASATTTDAGSDVPPTPAAPAATALEEDSQSLKSFASESFSAAREGAAAAAAAATAPANPASPLTAAATPVEERKPKSKLQLWEEIKIGSLTRSFTLLYTLALLTLLTRIQLNLLGRKNYLSSVVSLAERDNDPTIRLESNEDSPVGSGGIDMETNRQYLTFSWWLLHHGWKLMKDRVEAATKEVFGSLTPRDTVSLKKFRELTEQLRQRVESPSPEGNDTANTWIPYLVPPAEEEHLVLAESGTVQPDSPPQAPSPELRRLLDETSDLAESPTAATVLSHMFSAGFDMLVDEKLAPSTFRSESRPLVSSNLAEKSKGPSRDDGNGTAKFASVLAALARQAHAIGNGNGQNEYLKAMESGTELEAFSALVYSSNFEFAAQPLTTRQADLP